MSEVVKISSFYAVWQDGMLVALADLLLIIRIVNTNIAKV
jgi:hypothetical protein